MAGDIVAYIIYDYFQEREIVWFFGRDVIGEAVFGKIFRNFALRLFSVALGSILYYLVLQAVIWMGIDTDLLKLLSALVVAVFLAVPYWKAKYFAKPMKRGGNTNA